MNKKKTDNIIRFILIMLPVVMCIVSAISVNGTQSTESFADVLDSIEDWLVTIPKMSFFTNFNNWINTNLFAGTSYSLVNITLYSVEYMLFVELVLLFKNVMCLFIDFANKMIRGLIDND